jgi:D-3-phosphoglycerate dehydrogenase
VSLSKATSSRHKVVFLMPYPDWEVSRIRSKLPDSIIEVPKKTMTEKELLDLFPDAEVIIPVNNTRILTKTVLQSLKNLRLIQQAGTGLENIDLGSAEQLGITVATAVGANAQTVAEHTFALILSLSTKLKYAEEFVRNRHFKDEPWPPRHRTELLKTEISGKTIGLVGLGSVGIRVARIAAEGFAMKVLAYDPYVKSLDQSQFKISLTDLQTLLPESDVISIHCLLTNETRGMIGPREFQLMKKTPLLINTARGPIVDEKALLEALSEGRIAGAGLDTFSIEPPDVNNPLLNLPNVVLTPHIGGNSVESKTRVQDVIIENIRRLETGTPLLNVVVPSNEAKL